MKTVVPSPPTGRDRHRPRLHRDGLDVVDILAEARGLDDFDGHRRVLDVHDASTGLYGFIAIHDITLGPALGGCRMVPYGSRAAAITDALRLSRGMTFKAALAGLELGGGKAVLIGNPRTDKTEGLFRSLGAAVEQLGGEYYTGEDAGTSVSDIDWVAKETSYVIGTSANGGDPAELTALGVFEGIRAALWHRTGGDQLSGATVAVQGVGHVGYALCRQLSEAGARLVISDIVGENIARAVTEFGADVMPPDQIHCTAADVFAPCALGGVLDDATIPELRCAVVVGSANNQLAREEHGAALRRRGILFAPDYVANSGGLISVGLGLFGEDPKGEVVRGKIRLIGATLTEIFERADEQDAAPSQVADQVAAQRIAARRRQRHQVA